MAATMAPSATSASPGGSDIACRSESRASSAAMEQPLMRASRSRATAPTMHSTSDASCSPPMSRLHERPTCSAVPRTPSECKITRCRAASSS